MGGREQELGKVGHLGQSWQPWPLKGQGAQNSDAVRGKDLLIREVMKQEVVEGSGALPPAKAQIQFHPLGVG